MITQDEIKEQLIERISLGRKSQHILDDPHWKEIHSMVREALFDMWRYSDDPEAREEIWHVQKALALLEDALNSTAYDFKKNAGDSKKVN